MKIIPLDELLPFLLKGGKTMRPFIKEIPSLLFSYALKWDGSRNMVHLTPFRLFYKLMAWIPSYLKFLQSLFLKSTSNTRSRYKVSTAHVFSYVP